MSVKVVTQVIGFAELEKALKELGSEVAGKTVLNALNAGARDVEARMKRLAPESEHGSNIDWHKSKNGRWVHGGPHGQLAEKGRLKRSIFHFKERNPHSLSEIVYIGPRLGESRNDPNGAWYAAIVEMHGGKGGQGKGFMRNSIDKTADLNTITKSLATNIERVAKKVGNENARAVASKVKKGVGSTQSLLNWRPPS